ncbi:unnamed protein product [Bursaphelenchus okinawaensis]|uniref:DUF4139 domain-containing protein n=1 Tax=Bursaphelenchus okinawaensis TaxID=465554 RepID=A0A811LQJ8_9BILA|nr:unnamed protein product [Bursaphelenchus okinawaensis]CAG9127835.1 unnamed protein product [Bursaphelenchus okinawaensis]
MLSTKTFRAPDLPIKSVLCFRHRAEVHREFDVTLELGTNKIIVERLPPSIISASIRVDAVSVHADAILRDVQYKETYSPEEENFSDELKLLIKELDNLLEEQEKLKDRENLLNIRGQALDKMLENLVTPKDKERMPVFDEKLGESFNKALEYYELKQTTTKMALRTLMAEKKVLTKDIKDLQQRVTELKDIDNFKRTVHIAFDATTTTPITVKLTYNVTNANWETSYDVRVDSTTKKLSLHYLASITQTTGEDWKDIALSLSTSEPQDAGKLPSLNPIIAKLEQKLPEGAFGTRTHSEIVPVCFAAESAPVPRMKMALRHHSVTVKSNLVATNYVIPLVRTIPSKPDDTRVTIAVKSFDYDLERQVVPSKNTTVFLVASIVNNTELHFIEGPVKVYVDNCYANELYTDSIAPNERFHIELGKDPNVKVHYKPKDTFQQQSGVITKSNVTANEQKIIVSNNCVLKTLVTVFEQVPKSNDEKIKIKLASPDARRLERAHEHKKREVGVWITDKNLLEWTVELPPKTETELVLKYNVEYPQNENVVYEEQY